MCVTSRPFAEQFLHDYLRHVASQASGRDSLYDEIIDRGFVIPAEGNIDASLRRFADRDREIGEAHGRVDLAFYTGARQPRLTQQEAHSILKQIHFLLRPGGALLLGFPTVQPPPHHLSATELHGLALQAGFSTSGGLRPYFRTGSLANSRAPVYSFLRKQ
ncbi:hypothetical protein ACGF5O_37775 [Streptomyces sp. NPDC048291]|uniref:hypothetical protein n=1 Tax=Streptomyces sp. NPDC048291 TaxID=3365530 RepID=UPI00371E31D4